MYVWAAVRTYVVLLPNKIIKYSNKKIRHHIDFHGLELDSRHVHHRNERAKRRRLELFIDVSSKLQATTSFQSMRRQKAEDWLFNHWSVHMLNWSLITSLIKVVHPNIFNWLCSCVVSAWYSQAPCQRSYHIMSCRPKVQTRLLALSPFTTSQLLLFNQAPFINVLHK